MHRPHVEREELGDRVREHGFPQPQDLEIGTRGRVYRLNTTELRTLRTVGMFRSVNTKDIGEVRLGKLLSSGLMERKTVYPRHGRERLEVLVLTKKGRELLESQQPMKDLQRFHAGLVKPREVAHDAAIYPAYQDQAEEIEKAGGSIRRVVLDFELKSAINREMNRREGPPAAQRRAELAKEYGLPVEDGKLALPDLRIEYTDADGREQHRDIEIVTRHYRGAHRASKAASGFRIFSKDGPRNAVHDDHHLGWI